jgi:class 3 adenylate cyclase
VSATRDMSRDAGRRATPRRRSEGAAVGRAESAQSENGLAAGTRDGVPRLGVRVRACVVLARVRGLTQVAARLDPTRVVRLLEEFFATMTDVAVARRAMVDTLLGDAIVLFYGIPLPRRDDPLRAVRTAIEMQRAFLALRNRWLAAGQPDIGELGLAVGVAAGEVLVGRVRPGAWLDYTAVGEPVNTAGALCAAARDAETLIDEAVHASASVRLEDEVVFTSRALGGRSRDARTAYRVQAQRAGLRVVPPRPMRDPVCGGAVDPRRAVRDGDRYFCSAACARRFVVARDD